MLPLDLWLILALALTAIATYFDLHSRKIPYVLLIIGIAASLVRLLTSRLSYIWLIGGIWLAVALLLAWRARGKEKPLISEGDLAWYGILGALLGYPILTAFFVGLSLIIALFLSLSRRWRTEMPYLVPMLISLVIVVAVVLF